MRIWCWAISPPPETTSRLKRSTAEPSRTPISYTIDGRSNSGDLYLPGEGVPEAGVVLVPGAVPEGKDHESLVELAHTLARVRFAVLTPELSGYRDLEIRPDQVREVADAFRYLVGPADLSPDGRAGIGAFSFAVGPAVLAALEEDTRDRVRFVFGVGGYHDLRLAIRFFTTGYFEDNGKLLVCRALRLRTARICEVGAESDPRSNGPGDVRGLSSRPGSRTRPRISPALSGQRSVPKASRSIAC